jgi:hypothetical protein
VARLGRRGRERGQHEGDDGRRQGGDDERTRAHPSEADQRQDDEHDEQHDVARGQVAGGLPHVLARRLGAATLAVASGEDGVGVPERQCTGEHDADPWDGFARASEGEVRKLPEEDQSSVRMGREHGERCHRPPAPAPYGKREERRGCGQQEERVHAPEEGVEEEDPARAGEGSRCQRTSRPDEPFGEQRHQRNRGDGAGQRDEAEGVEPAPEVHDHPREQVVEWRAAPLGQHRVEHPAERVAADEEREHLVLVRRVGTEAREAESENGRHTGARAEREELAILVHC